MTPTDGNLAALADHMARIEQHLCPVCGAEVEQDEDGAECTECDWHKWREEE